MKFSSYLKPNSSHFKAKVCKPPKFLLTVWSILKPHSPAFNKEVECTSTPWKYLRIVDFLDKYIYFGIKVYFNEQYIFQTISKDSAKGAFLTIAFCIVLRWIRDFNTNHFTISFFSIITSYNIVTWLLHKHTVLLCFFNYSTAKWKFFKFLVNYVL